VLAGRPAVAGGRGGGAVAPVDRGALVVVAAAGNAKNSLGARKSNGGSNLTKKRTSGYRARKASVGGRKVLKARRRRGRKRLVPASEASSKYKGGKKERPRMGR